MRAKKGNEKVDLIEFRNRVEKVTNNAKQNDIEEMCGFKYGELSKIYGGHASLTIDHLIKLSNAYYCSIDYLLGRDDTANRDREEMTAYDLVYALAVAEGIGAVNIKTFESWDYHAPNFKGGEVPQINSVVIRVTNSMLNDNLRALKGLMGIKADTEELGGEMLSMWLTRLKEKRLSIKGADMLPK